MSERAWGALHRAERLGPSVGPLIDEAFLPQALARYAAAAPPLVVGHGLDCIPDALERQRLGVGVTWRAGFGSAIKAIARVPATRDDPSEVMDSPHGRVVPRRVSP